ncbi:MAG: MmcQ/YjbR family DNA-binding protein [Bacteroidota bacterium]|jgi:predicted DNA-binding protein (MmcQ/YjbR family)
MINFQRLQEMALAFPETEELPHFEKTSFRVKNKIFATFDPKKNQATVKLSESDQDIFSLSDKDIIFPVPNKWGKQGWTIIKLNEINDELFSEILKSAYFEVIPKRRTK